MLLLAKGAIGSRSANHWIYSSYYPLDFLLLNIYLIIWWIYLPNAWDFFKGFDIRFSMPGLPLPIYLLNQHHTESFLADGDFNGWRFKELYFSQLPFCCSLNGEAFQGNHYPKPCGPIMTNIPTTRRLPKWIMIYWRPWNADYMHYSSSSAAWLYLTVACHAFPTTNFQEILRQQTHAVILLSLASITYNIIFIFLSGYQLLCVVDVQRKDPKFNPWRRAEVFILSVFSQYSICLLALSNLIAGVEKKLLHEIIVSVISYLQTSTSFATADYISFGLHSLGVPDCSYVDRACLTATGGIHVFV